MTMQRFISIVLSLALMFGACIDNAFAGDSSRVGKIKRRIENLPIGARVRVVLNDDSEIEGRLSVRGVRRFELETPDPVSIEYDETKSVRRIQRIQRAGQFPGQNVLSTGKFVLIALVVAVVFVVVVAVQLKKS